MKLKNEISLKDETIVTGFQPTGSGIHAGVPHLGNMLGVMKGLPDILDKAGKSYVMVADIHATTMGYNPADLRRGRINLIKSLLAFGIEDYRIFVQSSLSEHFEIGTLVQHNVTLGQLGAMTQFRAKASLTDDTIYGSKNASIPAGLLTYPALMAGDVFLYGGTVVPAGDDQTQHIRFIRDTATLLNKRYGLSLKKPNILKSQAMRVMQLNNPFKKMSKSEGQAIYLTDTLDTVSQKYKRATTGSCSTVQDSYDNLEPGTINLLNILSGYTGVPVVELLKEVGSYNFSALKDRLIAAHEQSIGPVRETFIGLSDEDARDAVTVGKNKTASPVASRNMSIIRDAMGMGL